MLKKMLSVVLVAFTLLQASVAVIAYDTPTNDYSSDVIIPFFNDASEGWPTWNKRLKEFAASPSSYDGGVLNYFGVYITGADSIIDVMYELTLANRQKEYYLPQVDFLRVSMGDKVISIDINMELEPLPAGEKKEVKTINIPGELLYYTVPDSDTDKILKPLSEAECNGIDFYGVKLKKVTVIARNEPSTADEGNPLVLYSIKLRKNSDVTPLIMLLNSNAMTDSRSEEFHTLIGYSAIQSCYYDKEDTPPETTIKENELVVGVDIENELYNVLSDLARSNTSNNTLLGYGVISAKILTDKQSTESKAGYTVYRVKCRADTDVYELISALNTRDALSVIRAYETEEVLVGDVNEDGVIDNLDAAWVLKYDAGLIADIDDGDYNSDGVVDNLDAASILKFDAGLIR